MARSLFLGFLMIAGSLALGQNQTAIPAGLPAAVTVTQTTDYGCIQRGPQSRNNGKEPPF